MRAHLSAAHASSRSAASADACLGSWFAQGALTPARASLCFASAQTADENADFINSPPVFGAPAADSDLDSSDMTRPRLAGGIRPADLPCQHTHSHAPPSSEYVSLGDDCKWCDVQWQKDVKLLTAGREGNLEGVLRAIEEGLGSRV